MNEIAGFYRLNQKVLGGECVFFSSIITFNCLACFRLLVHLIIRIFENRVYLEFGDMHLVSSRRRFFITITYFFLIIMEKDVFRD